MSTEYALVLGSYPYGEGHKVAILFTESGYIKRVVAHGTRLVGKKLSGHFELLTYLAVELRDGRGHDSLPIVKESEVIQNATRLRETMLGLAWCGFISELLAALLQENTAHPDEYEILHQLVNALNPSEPSWWSPIRKWERGLLQRLGYLGHIYECSHTGEPLSIQNAFGSPIPGYIVGSRSARAPWDYPLGVCWNWLADQACQLEIIDLEKLDRWFHDVETSILGKPLKSEAMVLLAERKVRHRSNFD